jgi:hypothetical protein
MDFSSSICCAPVSPAMLVEPGKIVLVETSQSAVDEPDHAGGFRARRPVVGNDLRANRSDFGCGSRIEPSQLIFGRRRSPGPRTENLGPASRGQHPIASGDVHDFSIV